MKVVILDNYDSFTFNLFQMVAELAGGIEPLVFRNDAITVDRLRDLEPDRIVISPGPGRPELPGYFGICRQVILEFAAWVPILGVCLGHIGIVEALGGRIVRAPKPRHGKTSLILHDGTGIFTGMSEPLEVMRYHSLIAERKSLPECLAITAWTDEGLVMGVRHRQWPLVGVQFHPESIGTACGRDLVATFLEGRYLVDRPLGPAEI